MAAVHPLSARLTVVEDSPVAHVPASPVRVLLGRYQQVLDRVEEGRGLMWAPLGRRRFTRWLKTPAPRTAVLVLLTVHVRTRLRVLERRNKARIALLKEGEHARRDLETLTHFGESLRRTPGGKLVAPAALAGVLMAAFVLAKLLAIVPGAGDLLGNLTKAAVTLDPGDMVDAVTKSHMDPFSLLCVVIVVLWSMALVTLPLVPAAGVVRHLVAAQPGLSQAEAAGFAELRARPPVGLELGLLAEACLVGSWLGIGLAVAFVAPLMGGETLRYLATSAGWIVLLGVLTGAGLRARLHGRRPNRALRIARRVLVVQAWAIVLFMAAALIWGE